MLLPAGSGQNDSFDSKLIAIFLCMVKITFYYKDGCWLCDAAQEMLNGLKEKYGIHVTRIAIDSTDELYELYRFDIPVFEFSDGSALHGHIRKKALLEKLEENEE
ncbi:MAG: glutaredoxin family protein [Nitrospiraceae bacterium]|nr:MAG: glutaredoxin family protein [Nitrospiraceae bacterium]